MSIEASWSERFYTTLIYRDICHLFSGGLFISTIIYALYGQILFPKGFNLESLGFLMTSYFLGIAFGIMTGNGRIFTVHFVDRKN